MACTAIAAVVAVSSLTDDADADADGVENSDDDDGGSDSNGGSGNDKGSSDTGSADKDNGGTKGDGGNSSAGFGITALAIGFAFDWDSILRWECVSLDREMKGASGVGSRLVAGAFDFGDFAAMADDDGIDCVRFTGGRPSASVLGLAPSIAVSRKIFRPR